MIQTKLIYWMVKLWFITRAIKNCWRQKITFFERIITIRRNKSSDVNSQEMLMMILNTPKVFDMKTAECCCYKWERKGEETEIWLRNTSVAVVSWTTAPHTSPLLYDHIWKRKMQISLGFCRQWTLCCRERRSVSKVSSFKRRKIYSLYVVMSHRPPL